MLDHTMVAAAAPLLPAEGANAVDESASGHSTARQRNLKVPAALQKLWNFVTYKTPSHGARVAESLDYEPVQNDLYFGRLRHHHGESTRHVQAYGCERTPISLRVVTYVYV